MVLRRKYKINESDLDQIPGKNNRKRKKKRSAPAVVKDGPSSRSAGSGPKVKTLDPDSYDSHICAICLAPMAPAFAHTMNKSAGLPVTLSLPIPLPLPLSGDHSSALVSIPSSTSSASSSSSLLTSVYSPFKAAGYESSVPHKSVDFDARKQESFNINIVDLSADNDNEFPSGRPKTPVITASAAAVAAAMAVGVGATSFEITDLTALATDSSPNIMSSNPTPVPAPDTSPKYFQPLVCSECGIYVHLGCVNDTGGSAGLTLHMLAGNHDHAV